MCLKNDALDKGTLKHVKKLFILLKCQLKQYIFGSSFADPSWTHELYELKCFAVGPMCCLHGS